MSIEAMKQALNKAFQLGQRYSSWADSEYSSHWKKADAAKAEFDKLVEDTLRTAIEQYGKQEPVALEEYDAGLLNDYGGGNVEWWQDYIRAELGRAYEHYQSQMATPPAAIKQDLTPEPAVTLQEPIYRRMIITG